MPLSLNFSKENGLEFNGVRGILAILGLFVLCYLSVQGNQLATGALIPTLQKLLEMYAKGQENGKNNIEIPKILDKSGT